MMMMVGVLVIHSRNNFPPPILTLFLLFAMIWGCAIDGGGGDEL